MDNSPQQFFTGVSLTPSSNTQDPPPPPDNTENPPPPNNTEEPPQPPNNTDDPPPPDNTGEPPSPPDDIKDPPPPDNTGNPPPDPKLPGKFPGKVSTLMVLAILLVGLPLIIAQTNVQQIITGRAWLTATSAFAQCTPLGIAEINMSFTNKESSRAMLVVAKDSQTGLSVDMGKILAGQKKTATIDTKRTSLNRGSISFKMGWADGSGSTDTTTASYPSVSTCPRPSNTPTPRPTNTPTPRPTNTPTPRPTITPTPKPTKTPTPTPRIPTMTVCPTPGTVKNIQIKCPNCDSNQSEN